MLSIRRIPACDLISACSGCGRWLIEWSLAMSFSIGGEDLTSIRNISLGFKEMEIETLSSRRSFIDKYS